MENDNINNMDIEKRLANVKYKTGETSHLILNQEICKVCEDKTCLNICPANVYKQAVSGENADTDVEKNGTICKDNNYIDVEYENCLECGACRVACPYGAIGWSYPSSGCGVSFKFS